MGGGKSNFLKIKSMKGLDPDPGNVYCGLSPAMSFRFVYHYPLQHNSLHQIV